MLYILNYGRCTLDKRSRNQRFGAWLTRVMEEAGLGLAEVARRYGNRAPQLIYKYKKGKIAPVEAHADELSAAVERPPNELRAILAYPLLPESTNGAEALIDRIRPVLSTFSPAQVKATEIVVLASLEAIRSIAA
jgi:hypothetical protein